MVGGDKVYSLVVIVWGFVIGVEEVLFCFLDEVLFRWFWVKLVRIWRSSGFGVRFGEYFCFSWVG